MCSRDESRAYAPLSSGYCFCSPRMETPAEYASDARWGIVGYSWNVDNVGSRDAVYWWTVEVPLRAGSALFFHSLTAHGSGPNPVRAASFPAQKHEGIGPNMPPAP